MNISNHEIAAILRKMADTLEIYLDNPYRIRAYRRAARSLEHLSKPITDLIAQEIDLTTIPNVGKGIAAQINVIVATGNIPEKFLAGLETKPFKSKLSKPYKKMVRYKVAEMIISHLKENLESLPSVNSVTPVSSFRRKNELVGTVELLVTTTNSDEVMNHLCNLPLVREIVTRDEITLTVILRSTLQVTLKIVSVEKMGAALIYYTGSDKHIEMLKQHAERKGFELTEDGLFKSKNYLAGKTEEEIYQQLGLPHIPPELRENRGEFEAQVLPQLITLADIKGDLHSHTNETDGIEPLQVMVAAAMRKGYEYFAITDHSKRLAITNGMDEKRLLQQIKLIDDLNSQLKGFTILKGMEVDILADGSLDLSNDVLKELDVRVCSIHSLFKLPEEKQTERIIRAMDNPYFNILGHATGRLMTTRPPYPINIEKILQAAKERSCFIELNAQPARLDINDEYCLMAKKMGVKIAISSDAHSIPELDYIRFGINQARRGWLEADDVINTRGLGELKNLLRR